MTIMSDKWIKSKSTNATHCLTMIIGRTYRDIYINEENSKYKCGFSFEEIYKISNETTQEKLHSLSKHFKAMPLIAEFRELNESERRKHSLINPFINQSFSIHEDGTKVPSYGLSSYGYDVRIGRNVKLFKNKVSNPNTIIDICDFDNSLVDVLTDVDDFIIPPNGFALGVTVEHINMPRNFTATFMPKSTITRCGCIVHITPIESEWSGYVTIEISNVTKLPMKIKTGIGIAQMLFHPGNEECEISYKDRKGKYMNQPNVPITAKQMD